MEFLLYSDIITIAYGVCCLADSRKPRVLFRLSGSEVREYVGHIRSQTNCVICILYGSLIVLANGMK